MRYYLATLRLLLCGAFVGAVCGCASPEGRFEQTSAQVYKNGDEFGGVVFGAEINTKYLRGQQFMYKVRLMDERARAIKSINRAYQDERGNVAAQKTLMVLDGNLGSERAEVRIPANELELRTSDFPVWIAYGLYRPDGSAFAEVYRPMPRNTQTIVQRYVVATYGEAPSEAAPPPRRRVRRTVRRPARSRSRLWRPESKPKGPGFCPTHGVTCSCPLRQDVPPEYMGRRTRPTARTRRPGSDRPRPRRSPRSPRY